MKEKCMIGLCENPGDCSPFPDGCPIVKQITDKYDWREEGVEA